MPPRCWGRQRGSKGRRSPLAPYAFPFQFDEVIDDIMRLDDVLGYMNPEVHMPNTVSLCCALGKDQTPAAGGWVAWGSCAPVLAGDRGGTEGTCPSAHLQPSPVYGSGGRQRDPPFAAREPVQLLFLFDDSWEPL